MPIPDFQTVLLPVLRGFEAGAKSVAEILPALRKEFAVTDEEAAKLLPSGRVTTLQSRAHWARTYLSKAGLLRSPSRNRHEITEAGRKLLASGIERIDMKTLEQFPTYVEWRDIEQAPRSTSLPLPAAEAEELAETPEERIERDFAAVESALSEELVAAVQALTRAKA